MSTEHTTDNTKNTGVPTSANPDQQYKNAEGEKAPGEGSLTGEEPAKGMSMGSTFDESKEQDLDDLMHKQGGLNSGSGLPGPDEL